CYVEGAPRVIAWFCSRGVLEDLCSLADPSAWTCTSPIRAVSRSRRPVVWRAAQASDGPSCSAVRDEKAPISRARSALALLPFHGCADWLELAIPSMTTQTRRPEAIVVVDDASPSSPREIVERHPTVTLVRSPSRVGPYRLIQQVIEDTSFDT